MSSQALSGKTALVTGSSHGIGRELALGLALAGAKVTMTGRDGEALERLRGDISAAGGDSLMVGCFDLSKASRVEALIAALTASGLTIDILVNNAGVGSREDLRPIVEFDPEFWDYTLALNLTAPFLLARALVPGMVAQGYGRVINIASINGRVPSPFASAYVASKHGLIGLTRVLALEVAGSGVTANSICPGPVDVGDDRRLKFDAERAGIDRARFEQGLTPIGGRLLPADIAPLVVFLCTPGAATITGQAINIDKGMVMS
ncbi:MAG: SDR family NAD(P)-dependent oxidoreductase [Trueperaceae bacterium]|nr:MAG: SDR family NAD(P)-dependent oxidoreductase [Trueperaceae bacterium]